MTPSLRRLDNSTCHRELAVGQKPDSSPAAGEFDRHHHVGNQERMFQKHPARSPVLFAPTNLAPAGVKVAPDCGTSLASTASQVQRGAPLTQTVTGTGNIKQRIGVLPVGGSVVFTVTGTLNNVRQWSNTPVLVLPSGAVNTQGSLPSAPTIGHFQVVLPLIQR